MNKQIKTIKSKEYENELINNINSFIHILDARNWKRENSKVAPYFNDIVKATQFLPNTVKLSERIYCILNNVTEPVKCQDCKINNVKYLWKLDGYKKYCRFCGKKDKNTTRQETCLKKYGTSHVFKSPILQQKSKETCLKKYGYEYPTSAESVKQKSKETCLKKYGCEYSAANKDVISKMKNTFIQKYNHQYPWTDRRVTKFKKSKITKFFNKLMSETQVLENFTPLFTIDDYKGSIYNNKNQKIKYPWLCKKCNNKFDFLLCDGKRPRCPICEPSYQSIKQYNIIEYITKQLKQNVIKNNRSIIKPYELDIYIPEKKIAIEFNGVYWHSELNGKDRNYHLNKTKKCQEKNIKLIQIFEDEYDQKTNIVKNRIKHILGLTKYKIYARKCQIKEIDSSIKNKFLNLTHLQGEDKSNIKLGLFYKNRLVAVMTFCKLRNALGRSNIENQWELSRFSTLKNFNIIGGASKLLTHFETNYNPKKIITYADLRWSTGSMYYKLGFNLDHQSTPNYWYILYNKNVRYHRFNYRKNILHEKLVHFDPKISEWENMKNNNFDRIWDCGNLVFIKNY
jgi:hypothetical protein